MSKAKMAIKMFFFKLSIDLFEYHHNLISSLRPHVFVRMSLGLLLNIYWIKMLEIICFYPNLNTFAPIWLCYFLCIKPTILIKSSSGLKHYLNMLWAILMLIGDFYVLFLQQHAFNTHNSTLILPIFLMRWVPLNQERKSNPRPNNYFNGKQLA